MGLLDEAIREHLDLKRRRGADPEEIERAEHEALGPVRRGPDELDQPALDEQVVGDHDLAYDREGEWDEGFEDEEQAPELQEEPEYEDPISREPEDRLTHEAPLAADDPGAGGVPAPHPADSPPERTANPPGKPSSEETAEYEVEFDDDLDRESEDMLEETPEFLQDTPDHDRLWFEQRPPRDFDFGG